ncbi:protein-L-histidine N-pros-methyltransferase [Lycorma delicatula]|uniref:protein-L-histidine N-pros-methyltransferase n=1 Tax=Lycorma delicatula TaxID=130591 RepID=UPI003F510F19
MECRNGVCCAQYSDGTCKPFSLYRPRGALPRALYNKHLSDIELKRIDKDQWYKCNHEELRPDLSSKFLQMEYDNETRNFLEECERKSDHVILQIWYTLIKSILSWFLSHTNINGLLKRGSMFVFSSNQGIRLLNRPLGSEGTLLDLGAGDGKVTQVLANFYNKVYVTEVATTMKWALKRKGFSLLDINEWQNRTYDTISCLNLLDRCENPLTLLHDIKNALDPHGHVIIAIVLPYKPYVESGRPDHNPNQFLPITGETFEQQVNSLIEEVIHPAGFVVERWTRLPYLCEGDLSQSYYWLDDAVFILRRDS